MARGPGLLGTEAGNARVVLHCREPCARRVDCGFEPELTTSKEEL